MTNPFPELWPFNDKKEKGRAASSERSRIQPILGRRGVRSYVEAQGEDFWKHPIMALYVTAQLELVAAEPIELLPAGDFPLYRLVDRGHELRADAFIIVERQLGDRPRVDDTSLKRTNFLRSRSAELNMPLLDHLVLAGDHLVSVGGI